MSRFTRGQLAKQCGLHRETVRHYERCGLLKPVGRTASQYHLFDDAALQRLRHIKLLRDLDFPIPAVTEILPLLESPDAAEDERERWIQRIDARREALGELRSRIEAGVTQS